MYPAAPMALSRLSKCTFLLSTSHDGLDLVSRRLQISHACARYSLVQHEHEIRDIRTCVANTQNRSLQTSQLTSRSLFHAAKPFPPILIYLPPGPVMPSSIAEEENVISILRESSGATIARVNYRASSLHQYPTPYHDLLFGFDWIKENLLLDEFNRPYLSRMGVCGELMGGSLATMLALTENRLGESRIAAAAVNNPLVDWVFPDELPAVDPSELPEPNAPDETAFPADADIMATDLSPIARRRPKRAPKKAPLTSWQRCGDNQMIPTLTLSAERDVLFRKPEDYFDRFASPIHYFRSPHAQLIRPQADDKFASKQPDELIDIETQMDLNHYASVNNLPTAPEIPYLSRCRAYARHYPLVGTQVSLPAWSVTTGTKSPLSQVAYAGTTPAKRTCTRKWQQKRYGTIVRKALVSGLNKQMIRGNRMCKKWARG
jgi:acetyl esterase/lipase